MDKAHKVIDLHKTLGFHNCYGNNILSNCYGNNILKTYLALRSLIFFLVPKIITFVSKMFTKIESLVSINLS